MKFKLKAYSIWEFGKRVDANGNPHQEDSLFPAHGEQQDSDRLFVLCDGMGGHDAGEVASATVCEAMGRSVMASVPDSEALFYRRHASKGCGRCVRGSRCSRQRGGEEDGNHHDVS